MAFGVSLNIVLGASVGPWTRRRLGGPERRTSRPKFREPEGRMAEKMESVETGVRRTRG